MMYFIVTDITVCSLVSRCRTRNAVFTATPPDGKNGALKYILPLSVTNVWLHIPGGHIIVYCGKTLNPLFLSANLCTQN